jgi:starch-binding outer membrane protein, SusD/RagB family
MKKTLYIFIFLTLLLTSCSEEWVDLDPKAISTELDYYQSMKDVDKTCIAAYGMMNAMYAFDLDLILYFGGCGSDDIECGGENSLDKGNFEIDLFKITSSQEYISRLWGRAYKGIKLANYAIEKMDQLREEGKLPVTDEPLAKQRVAEMRFLKSFYYFLIATVYGGGPYFNEMVEPEMYSTPRMPIADIFHNLEKELLLAIPDLKEKGELPASDVGRATKGAARALLGKIYLYESSYAENYPEDKRFVGMENKYALALEQFDLVINDDDYALVGLDTTIDYRSWWNSTNSWDKETWGKVGGYRWIFTVDGDNSKESVWEIQFINDGLGWYTTRGTVFNIYTTARYIQSGELTKPIELGWSFNSPSKYLERAFGNNDERESGLSDTETYDGSLDPRYPVTIGKDGDSVLVVGSGAETDMWRLMQFNGHRNNLPTGYIGRKYEVSPAEFWVGKSSWDNGPSNIKHIRMGDVYLMAAEAALKTNDAAKALDYVNKVRTRARHSGIVDGYPAFTGYPKDLPAVTMADIMHERRIELGGEGFRFFDVVRWNQTHMFNVEVAEKGNAVANFRKGINEFFPVPIEEIQASKGTIEQNYGF